MTLPTTPSPSEEAESIYREMADLIVSDAYVYGDLIERLTAGLKAVADEKDREIEMAHKMVRGVFQKAADEVAVMEKELLRLKKSEGALKAENEKHRKFFQDYKGTFAIIQENERLKVQIQSERERAGKVVLAAKELIRVMWKDPEGPYVTDLNNAIAAYQTPAPGEAKEKP